ncbi:resistance-nodulation-cell division (RND) multidrug efflux membrane fusion protein MexC [Amylibacter ulvae]|uniref:Resistance-nodulation-cell division (RND) multidrug efflux membrane fusion protein MexC n=1 Tax=Paramylibacter ulvae TaxID=1651968 RepID=A0ABQ3D8A4_9RHOB|nr:HlyD family efflux transporter periplasmic adaptor subunit [Amylibacter ulvae]GHA57935.1 resistance-nodulation-cell division (RND) multidrug efflux membrane fusion protein MexC [Amylibacter ulvae]
MRFFTRSLLGMFITALTVILLFAAFYVVTQAIHERNAKGNRVRQANERVFAVNVAPIEIQNIAPVITTFGEVVSGRTLELRAAAAGTLVQMAPSFRDGSFVKQGDLLFQTNPAIFQANLNLANAELADRTAELEQAKNALILAQDELQAAGNQLTLRQQALERQRALSQRGLGTEANLETAELSASTAQQSVLSKRQALADAQARINSGENALARATINQQEALRKLDETTVTAKFDGALSDVTGVLGGLVNANEQLANLIDPTALEVSLRISTQEFANLSTLGGRVIGAKIDVFAPGATTALSATIDRISAAVGAGLTGRELFASFDSQSIETLRPGDFVTVSIREQVLQNISIIPASAITAAGEILLVTNDNRIEAKQVPILRKQGNTVIISADDIAGRLLILERGPQLGGGIMVEPRAKNNAVLPMPEMIKVTEQERLKLIAFVNDNARMPDDAKKRILANLQSTDIPKQTYERLSSRMGG